MKEVRVVELFAGVGGFRVGLERASKAFRVVWSNQWEPSRKKQEASDIYVARFGGQGHSNQDISTIPAKDIPDHDLLVGGFPCQDYSVARTAYQANGLQGAKGVLWWEIHRILGEKKPGYFFLENVDRLLKSPTKQRGRDFAVMLASLADLGYTVEWRVINAADYGMPQRRRRVFFLGYRENPASPETLADPARQLTAHSVFAQAFPVRATSDGPRHFRLEGDLAQLTDSFNAGAGSGLSPFANTGVLRGRGVWTLGTQPVYEGPRTMLGDVLQPHGEVPEQFMLNTGQLPQWEYLKGEKREMRTGKASGHTYRYSEGRMVFPDAPDRPSRTIITAEGGSAPSRFKHVVHTHDGRLRRLTPIELERLNMFPDDHTKGLPDTRRAFLMGNALVVGIVERVGRELAARISDRQRGTVPGTAGPTLPPLKS